MSTQAAIRKVGLIGCGRIAGMNDDPANPFVTTHARAIKGNSLYSLVSCCDPDPAAARAFAEKWGCARHFSKAGDLIASGDEDLIVIAASTPAHAPILKLALASPRPFAILCEKPLVGSWREWREIAPLLSASTRPVFIHYQRRFDRAHRELRRRIQAGRWGNLLSFHAHVAKGLLHNGCHMIDLIQFLLGDLASLRGVSIRPMAEDLAGTALATLVSGAEGTVTCLEDPGYSLFELDLVFAKGKVEIRQIGREMYCFVPKPSDVYPGFNDLATDEKIAGTLGGAFAGLYAEMASADFDADWHRAQALKGTELLMNLLKEHLP